MKGKWNRLLMLVIAVSVTACTGAVDVTGPTETPAQPAPTDRPSATVTPVDPADPKEKDVPEDTVSSAKLREIAPDVTESDLADLSANNAAFAFDLYRLLADGGNNLFFSPHSISLALAMTYAGARTDTERQMADALRFVMPQDRLHPTFNALDQVLATRGEGADGKDEQGFRLNIVNAIWGQSGFEFLEPFLDVLAESYGAGLRVLDFAGDSEGSRVKINHWVSEQTEGRIEDLIPAGAIDALTRLVLTNAIYYNAAWASPFTPERTQDGEFSLLEGNTVTVPMMRQSEHLGYAPGAGFQAVELPYDGHELSMIILLPDTGEFAAFEEALDADLFGSIIDSIELQQVALAMPKFEFESEFNLNRALAELGMATAFGGDADFSGMTGGTDLFISDVIHKAFVSVDEAGTEAAAATAVVMRLTAAGPEEPVEVVVNRPFVFAIRDIQTGAVLFVGRVVDPTA